MSTYRMEKSEELCRIKSRHDNFTFADIGKRVPDLQLTDSISITHDSGYDSSDSGWDESYTLVVTRKRLYTDLEQLEFQQHVKNMRAKSKFERYEDYIYLKGEFHNADVPEEPIWTDQEEIDRRFKRRNNK